MGYKKIDVCKSKRRFATVNAALTAITINNREGLMSYYLCNICKGFHLFTICKKVRSNNLSPRKMTRKVARKRK